MADEQPVEINGDTLVAEIRSLLGNPPDDERLRALAKCQEVFQRYADNAKLANNARVAEGHMAMVKVCKAAAKPLPVPAAPALKILAEGLMAGTLEVTEIVREGR